MNATNATNPPTTRARADQADQAPWSAYRAELLAFLRRRMPGDAAEDVVQDVLAKGYLAQGRLRDETRLRAWLFQIARNALADYYRKARPADELPADLVDVVDDEAAAPGVEQDLARCLVPMIDHLPDGYREAVVLSELEGVRQKDVARRLGLSFSGAKSRVQRGRHLLRTMMDDCCRILLDGLGRPMEYHCRQACGCS